MFCRKPHSGVACLNQMFSKCMFFWGWTRTLRPHNQKACVWICVSNTFWWGPGWESRNCKHAKEKPCANQIIQVSIISLSRSEQCFEKRLKVPKLGVLLHQIERSQTTKNRVCNVRRLQKLIMLLWCVFVQIFTFPITFQKIQCLLEVEKAIFLTSTHCISHTKITGNFLILQNFLL